MRNIKDFQERYNRWKNGERYWNIRGVDLPKYDDGNKQQDDSANVFVRPNGTYYATPTNEYAHNEDLIPLIQRNLSDPSTWDFKGSKSGKKYTTKYTDDLLKQMAYDSMPNAEMVPWVDKAGNKHRDARVIGLSPVDPVGEFVVENAALLPAWKGLSLVGSKLGNYLGKGIARDFGHTNFGNWLRNKYVSKQLNENIRNWDGTVGIEYFNSPYNWYRWTETPEIEGIREIGKNVTTRDANTTINVPSNNWRISAMNNYSKSEDGFWYKADKPAEDMSYKEYINWIKTNTNRSIGSGRKHGSAHGNKTHASYGIPWQSSLSTSGIGQKGILEGQVGVQIPFGKDKISFEWTPTEEVPMGNRIGFSTGEMPMDNLGWFTKLPNGRFKYNGEVLPYKKIEQPLKTGNGRYLFDSPTYQIYTGPKHEISEVINDNGSVNLKNLLNILNEALLNVPGGTIARHRLENTKWHPTDWNTFLHTRDVYDRALSYNYPQEALFPTLMHDVGKMWAGDGHGPYGASIVQLIFPEASKKLIQAIYGHMDSNPIDPLTRLVKGVDIKEPNLFSTEWVLRDMPPMFRRNFNVTEDTLGDIVQLAPIKGSEFDNYKTFIYNKLGRLPELSKLGIYPEYFFDRDVTGDFNPETGRARISANDDMPLSTAVHEDISHRSDDFVENELISNFIPETTIKQDVPTSVYYSDLANVTGNSKFREYTSEDWREMRATLNQLRFAAKKPLDDISNESIKSALNRVNGYGLDYANQLELLDDFHKQQWFDKLRTAWKYLPAIIPIIRYEKEK